MSYGLTGGLLWACDAIILNQVFQTDGLAGIGSFKGAILTAGLHDTFSAICVFLFLLLKYKPVNRWRKPGKLSAGHSVKQFIMASLWGGPVGMTCYLAAIGRVGAGIAASVSAAYPAAGSAMAAITGREKLGCLQKTGLALCVLGAVRISRTPGTGTFKTIGLLFAMLAALCWGLEGVICSDGLAQTGYPYDVGLFIRQLTSGVTYLLVLFSVLGIWRYIIKGLSGTVLLFTGLAGFTGAASYLCYYKAIERIGPSKAMAANVTYTAWAVVLEAVITRTVPGITTFLCIGLIFMGAVLVSDIQNHR